MVVESYSENNMSASMIGRHLDRYWLGLASLDDLRTNTLESAAGMLVSQYAGLYANLLDSRPSAAAFFARVDPRNRERILLIAFFISFACGVVFAFSLPLTIECLRDLDRHNCIYNAFMQVRNTKIRYWRIECLILCVDIYESFRVQKVSQTHYYSVTS